MSHGHRSSLLVRLSWVLCALLFASACIGTETGNPPVIDSSLLLVTVRGEQLEISGGAGAVLPGGSTLVITDLNGNRFVRSVVTAKDGSFSVLVDKQVRASLQAENGHGKSEEEAAPAPLSAAPPGAPGADAGVVRAPVTDADSSFPASPGTPVAPGAASAADSGPADTNVADASVSVDSRTSGATIASITANGTGCPAGTWMVDRTADTAALNVQFLGYEAQTEPGTSIAIKDCTLAVKVDSLPGEQFALTSAVYSGNASVDAGTTAELSTSYAFQGDPSASTTGGQSFPSQAAADFTYQDDIAESRAVWSACGVTRDLNITTRLRLTGGAGSVRLASLSGIQLSTRACASSALTGSTN